jgi:hypothetical protein
MGSGVLSTIFKQISFPTQIPRDSVTVLLPEREANFAFVCLLNAARFLEK